MTALLLVTALAFGMTVTAVAQQVDPVQVTAPAEFPTITVETNLVMNEASGLPDIITDEASGKTYGFIEVALRVTPGTSRLFSGAALALTYDETILTPVTWNELNTTTGKRDKYDVVNTATSAAPFDIFHPTKKADIISTASAYIGGTDGAGKSLLYLNAESEYPTTLTGDSRLVVVRFRYDATANPFTYDATNNQIMSGQTPSTPVTFVDWASDANAALSPAGANAYFTGKNEPLVRESMYYVHKDPNPAVWTKTDAGGLLMPDTACQQLVKAVKSGGTPTDADYYSYSTNFFPVDPTYMAGFTTPLTEPKIKFTQVTAATADQGSGGISLDDLSTILFYDWDDTLLGALTVPRGVDVREEVNTYVRENFIHPDLQYDKEGTEGAANLALIDNIQRTNSYRGTFPHDNPGGAENTGNFVTNGGDYPLTNKLDYTFFKFPMENQGDGTWMQMDTEGNLLFQDEVYPYIYGWAVVNIKDDVQPSDIWTTLGVGEMTDYMNASTAGMCILPLSDADYINKFQMSAPLFEGIADSLIAVKTIYEPGDENIGASYYEVTGTPEYSRYTREASDSSGVYSIKINYVRHNGNMGVAQMREPALRAQYTVDTATLKANFDENFTALYDVNTSILGTPLHEIMGFTTYDELIEAFQLNSFSVGTIYMEFPLKLGEIMEGDITPPSDAMSVNYKLIDSYGSTFMTGAERSNGDEFGAFQNFDNENFSPDARRGSDGFVYRGTLSMLLKEGSLKAQGKTNNYDSNVTKATLIDLGLQYNANTDFSNDAYANAGKMYIENCISAAIAAGGNYVDTDGYADLTWHQIQYYIINKALVGKGQAEAENYSWYKGPASH